MNRWCSLTTAQVINPGTFRETSVLTLSGADLKDHYDFVLELARRMMDRYESQPTTTPFMVLDDATLDRRARTRSFYRHIFDVLGQPNQDFATLATETMAEWIEQSLDGTIAYANDHGTNDPAYDIISFTHDSKNQPRLRLSQVKCTANNLVQNANTALEGFRLLDQGYYDQRLLQRLKMIERYHPIPAEFVPRNLVFSGQHHYHLYAFHSQHRASVTILTLYKEKIPGAIERRLARMIHIRSLNSLWERLAEVINAQLS